MIARNINKRRFHSVITRSLVYLDLGRGIIDTLR